VPAIALVAAKAPSRGRPGDDVRLPDAYLVIAAGAAVDLAGSMTAHGAYFPLVV
jgi:hypothetical protein